MQINNTVDCRTYYYRKQEKQSFKESHLSNQPINAIDKLRIKKILTSIIF